MLDHETKPFPSGDGRSVGRLAFSLEVIVGEARENFHRFGVEAFDELAVMVDTFRPLDLCEPALACEDPAYAWTWSR